MTVKDVISLTLKGINLDQMKSIKASDDARDLIELIKNGMSYADATEAVKLIDPASGPELSPTEQKPEEQESVNEWEEKYKELLAKTQMEKQRENNKNGDEEAEAQKSLEDAVRSFM